MNNDNHHKDDVMNGELLRTYQLLEEFSKGEPLTQRDVSTRLDIALGLANAYIKRLILKGYIKVKSVPPKRFLYYLTPKGFAEKSRLTYLYLNYSFNFYKETKRFFLSYFERLKNENIRRILFLGYGDMQEIASVCLKQFNIELVGILPDGADGIIPHDLVVYGFHDLQDMKFDCVLVFNDNTDIKEEFSSYIPDSKIKRISF